VFVYASDGEVVGISNDLLAALRPPNGAGLNLHVMVGQEMGRGVRGIIIELKPDASAQSVDVAKALVAAILSERLAVEGPFVEHLQGVNRLGSGDNNPKAQITITVNK